MQVVLQFFTCQICAFIFDACNILNSFFFWVPFPLHTVVEKSAFQPFTPLNTINLSSLVAFRILCWLLLFSSSVICLNSIWSLTPLGFVTFSEFVIKYVLKALKNYRLLTLQTLLLPQSLFSPSGKPNIYLLILFIMSCMSGILFSILSIILNPVCTLVWIVFKCTQSFNSFQSALKTFYQVF